MCVPLTKIVGCITRIGIGILGGSIAALIKPRLNFSPANSERHSSRSVRAAKKYCAQMQNRLVDACLQIFGGLGYMHEEPISRAFRDARLQRIGAGTDEIMNEVIAKRLPGYDDRA